MFFKGFSVSGYREIMKSIPLEVVMLGEHRYAIYSNYLSHYLPRVTTRGTTKMEFKTADEAYGFIQLLRPKSLEEVDPINE